MSASDLVRESLTQVALRALDLTERAEVVEWALRRVEEGASQPAIASLAGLSPQGLGEVDSLLNALLRQLGQKEPAEFHSGMLAAANIARQLGEGNLQPIDAARSIWSVARRAPASERSLRHFVGLASEWEDDPDHRDLYDEEIRSAALMIERWSS